MAVDASPEARVWMFDLKTWERGQVLDVEGTATCFDASGPYVAGGLSGDQCAPLSQEILVCTNWRIFRGLGGAPQSISAFATLEPALNYWVQQTGVSPAPVFWG